MPHSYTSNLIHCIFSTRERRKIIQPEWQERLWSYFGGIARANSFQTLAAGGIADHVHLLLWVPPAMPVAKAVQLIKCGSSKWVNTQFPAARRFEWQQGYGAFSISRSHLKPTVDYIERQAEHHKKRTFAEEFVAILRKHQIDYDPRYVFGWRTSRPYGTRRGRPDDPALACWAKLRRPAARDSTEHVGAVCQ